MHNARNIASILATASTLVFFQSQHASPSDQDKITAFLAQIMADKVADVAGKFTSWEHLHVATSREMRALGVTTPQRKLILAQRERYRTVAAALPAINTFAAERAKQKFEADVMASKA